MFAISCNEKFVVLQTHIQNILCIIHTLNDLRNFMIFLRLIFARLKCLKQNFDDDENSCEWIIDKNYKTLIFCNCIFHHLSKSMSKRIWKYSIMSFEKIIKIEQTNVLQTLFSLRHIFNAFVLFFVCSINFINEFALQQECNDDRCIVTQHNIFYKMIKK